MKVSVLTTDLSDQKVKPYTIQIKLKHISLQMVQLK